MEQLLTKMELIHSPSTDSPLDIESFSSAQELASPRLEARSCDGPFTEVAEVDESSKSITAMTQTLDMNIISA